MEASAALVSPISVLQSDKVLVRAMAILPRCDGGWISNCKKCQEGDWAGGPITFLSHPHPDRGEPDGGRVGGLDHAAVSRDRRHAGDWLMVVNILQAGDRVLDHERLAHAVGYVEAALVDGHRPEHGHRAGL